MRVTAARYLVMAATVLLAACASAPEPQPTPPTGQQTLDRSARLAFEQGQYAQAATLYQAALQAALAEDSPGAIIDAHFNLALCQTYTGEYPAALGHVARAEAERIRRGLPVEPDLQLLAGTIHYRAGNPDRARAELDRILEGGAASMATRHKAHFIAGLIAADRASADTLQVHMAALETDETVAATDRLELEARMAALDGDVDSALRLLDQVVALRRIERNYRGMVRALASAGDVAENAGRLGDAGNYFLRAGRSGAQRAEPEAPAWLRHARDLGRRQGDQALVLEVTGILESIETEKR